MVNVRAQSSTQEDTKGNSSPNTIEEMNSVMKEQCHQNQNLENNILNIQQH